MKKVLLAISILMLIIQASCVNDKYIPDVVNNQCDTTHYSRVIKPIIVNIVSKKIDELSTLKSIKELETTRNEVVLLIDKLNYVVSISGDTKIDGITLTKTTLTGFDPSGASGFTSGLDGDEGVKLIVPSI